MKCQTAHECIALAVYGELADDQKHQLEQHFAGCADCRRELEGAQALAKAMSLFPVDEPSPNLVARSRMRLTEALDSIPRAGWVQQFVQQFNQGFHRLRTAPVAASAVLVAGLAAGGYGGYRTGSHLHAAAENGASTQDMPVQVANISGIVQQAGSEKVEVHYNRLVAGTMEGSLDDPAIRQLLMIGAKNQLNSDVRANSVGLLAGECRAGHQCGDGPVRNMLMVSLLYDNNPGDRLAALQGLQPYIGDDTHVRDAILQSILTDQDSRVKSQAIALLQPVQADSSVQDVLHTVAMRDENPQIRDVSMQVLNQAAQVQ